MNDNIDNLQPATLPGDNVVIDPSGFYKLDPSGELLHGPNFVYGPNFTLLRAEANTYTYPVEGWYWFDTLEEAQAALNPSA